MVIVLLISHSFKVWVLLHHQIVMDAKICFWLLFCFQKVKNGNKQPFWIVLLCICHDVVMIV